MKKALDNATQLFIGAEVQVVVKHDWQEVPEVFLAEYVGAFYLDPRTSFAKFLEGDGVRLIKSDAVKEIRFVLKPETNDDDIAQPS